MSRVAVLLHAFPLDHRMWAHQQAGLEGDGWEVLALDLPGFGGTPLPTGDPSLVTVADDICHHLAGEGIDRYALGGVSLGGYVAMAMARRAVAHGESESIEALMLCDTKASADSDQAVSNRIRLAEAVLAEPGASGRILRQAVLPGLLGQVTHDTRPEVLRTVGAWLDEAEPMTVAWYQQAMAGRPDSHEVLAAITAPALVLWGSQDVLSPEPEQASLLAALGRGQQAVIDGAGHLAVVEDPEAVTEQLRRFLGEALGPS